jgi:uncharacterized protein YjiS (DUF1127 family)
VRPHRKIGHAFPKNVTESAYCKKATSCAGDHIPRCGEQLFHHHDFPPELEQAMTNRPMTMTTWNQFRISVGEWRRRMRSRDELTGLSDRSLRDIGLSRCDVALEASKRFWVA